MKTLIAVAVLAVALTGCGGQYEDKELTSDTSIVDLRNVTVYRNIDGFPNLVEGCAGDVAVIVTSRSASDGAAMVRVPEHDARCA